MNYVGAKIHHPTKPQLKRRRRGTLSSRGSVQEDNGHHPLHNYHGYNSTISHSHRKLYSSIKHHIQSFSSDCIYQYDLDTSQMNCLESIKELGMSLQLDNHIVSPMIEECTLHQFSPLLLPNTQLSWLILLWRGSHPCLQATSQLPGYIWSNSAITSNDVLFAHAQCVGRQPKLS